MSILRLPRAEPLGDELRVLVRPEHLGDRKIEFALEVDEGQAFGNSEFQCVAHDASFAWVPRCGGAGFKHGVEAAELPLADQPVLVDPGGERLKPCGVQVDGPALGVTGAGDQLRLLEDLDVFRDRLFGDREGFRQFVHGGRAPAEPGNDAAADRIGEGQEGRVEHAVVAGVHGVVASSSKPLVIQVNQPTR